MIYFAQASMGLDLICQITNYLDNNKCYIGAFIDLKKAFDTVDNDILTKKLFLFLWYSWYST